MNGMEEINKLVNEGKAIDARLIEMRERMRQITEEIWEDKKQLSSIANSMPNCLGVIRFHIYNHLLEIGFYD